MILLADGGSTKVDWCLINDGSLVKQIFTKGANPFFRNTEEISQEIRENLMPQLEGYKINSIYFFGAGCAFPEKNEIIREAIAQNIPNAEIHVASDLLGAAKSLCQHKKGIACILGTGSNSCFYDGVDIIDNISPLGYVLGDEGSGAVLGRLFIGNCLKNQFTPEIKENFFLFMKQNQAEILDNVYKRPLPNRYLASVSPFIKENLHNEKIYQLVYYAFKDFFIKNIMQYDYKNNAVYFTGSVAYHYKDLLLELGKELNIEIGAIIQSPMEGLIKYYGK